MVKMLQAPPKKMENILRIRNINCDEKIEYYDKIVYQ